MDSITHALYKAIAAEDAYQRRIAEATDQGLVGGLQPLAKRPSTFEAYAGAEGTDLHITLLRSPEVLALQLEFIAAGYVPPSSMAIEGLDVIISPGAIDLYAGTDAGKSNWVATLSASPSYASGTKKAAWTEQVC